MKRESGMYGRLNIVCGSVIGTLKRDRDSTYTFNKKSFKFEEKVSDRWMLKPDIFGIYFVRKKEAGLTRKRDFFESCG